MSDKKKIARNNTMYHSNTRQIRPTNTFHSNVSRANFKEFGMHPLTYHNNAIHNLKPFLVAVLLIVTKNYFFLKYI